VVIKTTAATDEAAASEKIARSTVAQVYARVLTDLNTAVTKLPDDNGTRADKYTALAFLSRVYLQMGNYAAARDAANEVIASGAYELAPIPLIPFTNKNTAESIWEIQQNEQNNAGQANDGMATFFASKPGIGRADVRMVTGFISSFYESFDFRRRDWYYVGTGARPGNTYCFKWNAFEQNLPVIRIAEMYLTRAECNLRLSTNVGDTPANDLDLIRSRSNASSIAVPVLADILNERVRELAFEGLRIHDIKRLKTATGSFAWNDNKLVFPIPQREVDASIGVIVQNPGY
jgi:starch-binding outer membrane protein, SusD/RagB family